MIGKTVTVTIDRPSGSFHPEYKDMYYPVNYGYIDGIIAPDGEEQDAYVLGVDGPVEKFTGKVIAVIRRNDDVEEKWVVAPEECRFTKDEIKRLTDFQEKFFDSHIILDTDIRRDNMTHKEKALELFAQGFHCSQAVLGAFAQELGLTEEQALSISGSFGGGMRNGEVCGACTGALMVLGMNFKYFIPGDTDSKEKNNAVTSEFLRRFKEANGSYLCRELLGYDFSDPIQQTAAREKGICKEFCPKMVASAVRIAEDIINENI